MGTLQLSNPFAALEHKKAKKKKEKSEREKRKKDKKETLELEKAIFEQPQISMSSWADCDDEDDWAGEPLPQGGEGADGVKGEEAEEHDADSDHEIIDLEEEFGVELGKDEDHEAVEEQSGSEKGDAKPDLPLPIPKKKMIVLTPERQLSKKELKKKEMEELDAVLAEFGIDSTKEEGEDSRGSKKKKKRGPKATGDITGKGPEGDEVGGSSTQSINVTPENVKEVKEEEKQGEEDEDDGVTNGDIDIETLKARLTKKKSGSKKSSAANLAAAEAKARAKKKGSKKDKSKFNQAPPRN